MRKFLKHSAAGLFVCSIALSVSEFASADTKQVGVSQQSSHLKNTARPENGVNKQDVARKYGNPDRKESAVGEPPISIWHYANYSVYFEYNKVLHTVLKKK
ncbi:MAG: hypothetical protein JKY01_02140 [Pseudomonadales bacterium]|nr:hypothetical protein [Pseudomonadales bacterium]